MKHLFVMDPLHKLHIEGDSTYTMMRECSDRGHTVYWCTPDELFILDGAGGAIAEEVVTVAEAPFFQRGERQEVLLAEMDVVWMRKDPPFDMSYIFATYILDTAPPSTLMVNDPRGLKLFNEKIWAMQFHQFQPPTLLSNNMTRLREFVLNQPEGAVLKPWDGNGGRGVLVIKDPNDRNLTSMIELLTQDGTQAIIAQGYLKDVVAGDKRILLIDGEPVGAILRVPQGTDHRANMHAGAAVRKAKLTERDHEICDALKPYLQEYGQLFVGIDIIGGMLTEINVTSPTGIREVATLDGVHLEKLLLDSVEEKVRNRTEA